MKDLLDKISSYNLFNNLFPGILFIVILEKISSFSLIQENIIVGVFFYYFVGLVISRIGSIIIEPTLKKIKFVKFTKYEEFVDASKKDEKINILSETNNMFRTLIALFVTTLLVKPYEILHSHFPTYSEYLFIALLLFLFLWSYKKQTHYIVKRVDCNKG